MMKQRHTPVESHTLPDGTSVLVKREDLCFAEPAPPFSKLRGLVEHLQKIKRDKPTITHIAYVESAVSMAGWGVAWACESLGFKSIIFNPVYKEGNTNYLLEIHRKKWAKFPSCTVINIKAGRQKVLWFWARKLLPDIVPSGQYVLLPLGLPFNESIMLVAEETVYTLNKVQDVSTIVISVGSGTMTAGVLKGLGMAHRHDVSLIGIVCRGYSETGLKQKEMYIRNQAFNADPLNCNLSVINPSLSKFKLIDPGWEYTQKPTIKAPFPCHPYYDLKAWQWLLENHSCLRQRVLFWNIGQEAKQ